MKRKIGYTYPEWIKHFEQLFGLVTHDDAGRKVLERDGLDPASALSSDRAMDYWAYSTVGAR